MSPPAPLGSPPPAPPLPALPQSRAFFDAARANVVANLGLESSARHDLELRSIKAQLKKNAPKSLCVIDMTASGEAPVIVGWEVERMMSIGSTAKLAALYAAFQLREDLRAAVEWSGARTFKKALMALRKAWGAAPSPTIKALAQLPDTLLPEFTLIFDTEAFDGSGTLKPEFRSSYGAAAQQGKYPASFYEEVGQFHDKRCPQVRPDSATDLEAYKKCYTARYAKLAKVNFNELLHLMMRWSDNEAASACISRLGLPFIEAMLRHSGLWAADSGLWLGDIYRELVGDSFRSPGPRKAVAVYRPEDTKEKKGTAHKAGNARGIAILLAGLVRGDLLPLGGDAMTTTFDFSPNIQNDAGANSPPNTYLFRGWSPPPDSLVRYLGKIGIEGPLFSEGAYVLAKGSPPMRKTMDDPVLPGPTLSYVVVALQAPSAEALSQTGKLVERMFDQFRR